MSFLNIFNFYSQNQPARDIAIANNLTCALAVCLKYDTALLMRFLSMVLESKDIANFYSEASAAKIDIQKKKSTII